MKLDKFTNVHCIGIGGIGVSALASILHFLNKRVTGSDLSTSVVTKDLEKVGIEVQIGKNSSDNIPRDTDLVMYSNAIAKGNPELEEAKKRNIPCVSYPEMLGELLTMHTPLVVTGTHGKSTTTAMLATIFMHAGLDPWVVMGTRMSYREMSGNARVGLGRHFIVEGDEYRAAFLHYRPFGLIINNIEADHLDFYKDIRDIISTFKKLVKSMPDKGFIVANADDPNVKKVISSAACRRMTFGLSGGDYQATHISQRGELTTFTVKGPERFDLALRVPGFHNVKNALAAALMAMVFGVSIEHIQQGLLSFPGVWRRFEIKGEKNGIVFIDDYAHHPTEIKATLSTARAVYPAKKVWCVFQPHSLDRTTYLLKEFSTAFADCDQLILTDIYHVAGRDDVKGVSIEQLAKAVRDTGHSVKVIKKYDDIIDYMRKNVSENDVILTVGAGSITALSDILVKKIK